MRPGSRAWTNADKARLREIVEAGGTSAQAAALLDRTRPAISEMLRILGLRGIITRSTPNSQYSRAEPEWSAVRARVVAGDLAFGDVLPHRFEDAEVPLENGSVSRPDTRSLMGCSAERCTR